MHMITWFRERRERRELAGREAAEAARELLSSRKPYGAWSEARDRRERAGRRADPKAYKHWVAVMDYIDDVYGQQERADTATRWLED